MDTIRFSDIDVDEQAERELFPDVTIFDRIQEVLQTLVGLYAHDPATVEVYRGVRGRQIIFKIIVHTIDYGMVVGKHGRNIEHISDVLKPIAARDNFGIGLEVIKRDDLR